MSADDTETGNFWLWAIPQNNSRFVVVPNPACLYNENLHFEGGMKETFASNYDENNKSAEYTKIEVKLPAIFVHDEDTAPWIVEQPGLINVA